MAKTTRARTSPAKPSKKSRRLSRNAVKSALEATFRGEFPTDTVDVSDGYKENIHIMVVSRRFDEMTERAKQELMWDIIDRTDIPKSDKLRISLVLPLSPAEIK